MLGMSFGAFGVVRAVRPVVQTRFGNERDLFTQLPEDNADGIKNDPLLIRALKLFGNRPVANKEKAEENKETEQQQVVRERNTFDIVRNRHRW